MVTQPDYVRPSTLRTNTEWLFLRVKRFFIFVLALRETTGWSRTLGSESVVGGCRLSPKADGHADTADVLKAADPRDRIGAAGVAARSMPPTELAAYIANEIANWGKAVKASGAKLE
jgi:hypothetical protein